MCIKKGHIIFCIKQSFLSAQVDADNQFGDSLVFISLRVTVVARAVGSFNTEDGNGSKNVTLKMSSRFFKLFLVYSNSLEMSKVGEFPWS